MIYLTSFKKFHEFYGHPQSNWEPKPAGYSIAMYQPSWYPELPVVDLFQIASLPDGKEWIRPRLFEGQSDPLYRYHERLLFLYQERWKHDLELGLSPQRDHLDQNEDVALCCWCPYDKAAKRQLVEYGTFVCHSWPVETFLKELGFEVTRDDDRAHGMVSCTPDLGFDA